MRTSGILMPVFSLPGEYGIGCFSKDAYRFVDFLKRASQTYWQILPLGPTSYGDSPYQSFSTFAGNPYFIDPGTLADNGLLSVSEIKKSMKETLKYQHKNTIQNPIPYEELYNNRFTLLRLAFSRVSLRGKKYREFIEKNNDWLDDYATFMALKDMNNGVSFTLWDDKYRLRDEKALLSFKKNHKKDIDFYKWLQFEFYEQWMSLKKYANNNGIRIIGDIPIYVSADSSDVWASPELFELDDDLRPTAVAGHPPDLFSKTGQLWGNPLYDWSYHKKTDYEWWTKRFEKSLELYDVIRIDHFRGFDEYYSIPAGDKTAEFGSWKTGPKASMFKIIENKLGKMSIIAEDLGIVTDGVRKLVADTGYPNMKIMQNAFDDLYFRDEYGMTNEHLPYNYSKNCVVYTGTHDNDTLMGFIKKCSKKTRNNIIKYLAADPGISDDEICDRLIRLSMSSPADYCIIPMTDHLHLDGDSRINLPGTLGGNWVFRADSSSLTKSLADRIKTMTNIYGRKGGL